ncbi:FtsW/RodA/SpoVE family cell cycle protein [Tunicatimonas pelagia]|uniref:FtsW/RodA/SpoVE family cell cycle protein n=1 Tax=Tunicatimonas pelagia TaxID=931531 RepID=UPI002665711B|nr:FtsW/RodA/SpoVE family cell cycle protein [Tunicatimonas pelagia]WKN41365.1 FtsW/RodA/SpoVE family cell cycle protein [Tunicatimonas pelagia]
MMVRSWAKRYLEGDSIIWLVVLSLSAIGVLVVYSTSSSLAYRERGGDTEYYLFKHIILLVLSLGAMWFVHKINYQYFARLSTFLLLLSIPLLLYTWKFGATINEASRWITLPVINQTFQPSDLAKLALITHLAGMLSRRQQIVSNFTRTVLPVMLWCGTICGIIAMTDISSAAMLFFTCLLLMYIGRVPVKHLAMLVVVGGLLGYAALSLGQRGETALSRVESFMSEEQVTFQNQQAYIAIATGGVSGKGMGKSEQRNILPLSYADFIYAIIIEEYGVIGGIGVILLFLVLLFRGMRAVSRSERAFGGLLSAGLSFAIAIQAMINMAVAVGLVPVTGLPLPLVSMGGTSLLFTSIAIGIILSTTKEFEYQKATA